MERSQQDLVWVWAAKCKLCANCKYVSQRTNYCRNRFDTTLAQLLFTACLQISSQLKALPHKGHHCLTGKRQKIFSYLVSPFIDKNCLENWDELFKMSIKNPSGVNHKNRCQTVGNCNHRGVLRCSLHHRILHFDKTPRKRRKQTSDSPRSQIVKQMYKLETHHLFHRSVMQMHFFTLILEMFHWF